VEPVPNISGSAFDPHFVRLFLKPVIYTSTLARALHAEKVKAY